MSIYSEQLQRKIQELQTLLKSFPEGSLICAKNGSYHKWYKKDGTASTYIPKKQRIIATQLAMKKYYTLMLEDLHTEYKAVQSYMKKHKEDTSSALLQKSGYEELLRIHFQPLSQELADWENQPYERNMAFPEQLIHKCNSGILVRSKSESLIVMSLHLNRIPFRYECALKLGETTCYPDFTIRHPKTGQVFYWEHFGMMDQASYAKNTASKLQLYISHGLIPTIQLITTYETREQPLTVVEVERIVEQYFL